MNELKDSTWHYFSVDSVLMMSEQYQKGKLNGVTKTYYYTGELYEIKNWTQGVENGSWIQYFIKGRTKMETLINQGVREGKVIHYFPSGKVYCNGSYFADDRSGIWEYFTEEGVSDTIINYNE